MHKRPGWFEAALGDADVLSCAERAFPVAERGALARGACDIHRKPFLVGEFNSHASNEINQHLVQQGRGRVDVHGRGTRVVGHLHGIELFLGYVGVAGLCKRGHVAGVARPLLGVFLYRHALVVVGDKDQVLVVAVPCAHDTLFDNAVEPGPQLFPGVDKGRYLVGDDVQLKDGCVAGLEYGRCLARLVDDSAVLGFDVVG